MLLNWLELFVEQSEEELLKGVCVIRITCMVFKWSGKLKLEVIPFLHSGCSAGSISVQTAVIKLL